jgi:hypothetical protein
VETSSTLIVNNVGGVVSLTVRQVAAEDDDARFFCHAENVAGSATSSAEVHVKGQYGSTILDCCQGLVYALTCQGQRADMHAIKRVLRHIGASEDKPPDSRG